MNLVQSGFDENTGKTSEVRKHIPVKRANKTEMKRIFSQAWGMNYFYVRRSPKPQYWVVQWMSQTMLGRLTNNLTVTQINYPSKTRKQLTVFVSCPYQRYKIEIRNSAAGVYPNDVKFRLLA